MYKISFCIQTGVRSYTRPSADQKAAVNTILNGQQAEETCEKQETNTKPDEGQPSTAAKSTSTMAASATDAAVVIRIENCVVNFSMK